MAQEADLPAHNEDNEANEVNATSKVRASLLRINTTADTPHSGSRSLSLAKQRRFPFRKIWGLC